LLSTQARKRGLRGSSFNRYQGFIKPPKHPHNFAWGDAAGSTLHMTARNALYRMPLNIPGVRPHG
jgi:hypothetical protein